MPNTTADLEDDDNDDTLFTWAEFENQTGLSPKDVLDRLCSDEEHMNEYCVVEIVDDPNKIQNRLNDLAQHSWRLVSTAVKPTDRGPHSVLLFLERPKTDA